MAPVGRLPLFDIQTRRRTGRRASFISTHFHASGEGANAAEVRTVPIQDRIGHPICTLAVTTRRTLEMKSSATPWRRGSDAINKPTWPVKWPVLTSLGGAGVRAPR